MNIRLFALPLVVVSITSCSAGAAGPAAISGRWQFNADQSTQIAPWGDRVPWLEIRDRGDAVTIVHDWRRGGRGAWIDSLTVLPGREPTTDVVSSPIWPEHWFMGVLAEVGSERTARATWLEAGRRLVVESEQVVNVSQGKATIVSTCEYAVDGDGDRLTLTERRSTRPTPVILVFDRVAAGTGPQRTGG